ncbi:MAG TPA: ATP-binding protein [Opitutaceae bacterium]|nr:ATP-binding protein [Opitutaceae bacterium]
MKLPSRIPSALPRLSPPANIAAVYCGAGAAWIIVTDLLMAWWFRWPVLTVAVAVASGIAFVVVAGIMATKTIRRYALREAEAKTKSLLDEHSVFAAGERVHLLDAALQAAPTSIVITDSRGHIEWVNPAFEKISGYPSSEVIGKTPRVLKSGKHPQPFYDELWRTITAGNNWQGEICNRAKDGRIFREAMTIAPIRDQEGAIRHYVAIKEDITESKALEGRLMRAQRLESIGLLASGVAHDLNNVLAPILMSIDWLKTRYPTTDSHQILDVMESSAQRGAGVVRQVLTFAHGIEGERVEIVPRHLIRELQQMITGTFPPAIEIDVQFAPDLKSVTGDPTQLHQVLLNLAVNARDAMPSGGTLTISAENCRLSEKEARLSVGARPGDYVLISVSDTGTGIPPEILDRIFDPFFTTKPKGRGTGLGLSTVHGLVRSHGGFVTVNSALGVGSRFTLYLPAAEKAPAQQKARGGGQQLQGGGRRLLLVDDELAVRRVGEEVLSQFGFSVVTASDGIEALEKFRAFGGQFTAVITDVGMPRMSGDDLAAVLRSMAPNLSIIASTGILSESQTMTKMKALKAAGVEIVLNKPFTSELLMNALKKVLPASEQAEPMPSPRIITFPPYQGDSVPK